MPATKIFEDDDEFPEGDRWEALAWDVPEVEGIEFEGLRSHIQKFLDEVETIHEQEFV